MIVDSTLTKRLGPYGQLEKCQPWTILLITSAEESISDLRMNSPCYPFCPLTGGGIGGVAQTEFATRSNEPQVPLIRTI